MSKDDAAFLKREYGEKCAHWEEAQWECFQAKIVEMARGGKTMTGRGIRFCADAVNELFPAPPPVVLAESPTPIDPSTPPAGAASDAKRGPDFPQYSAEIRRKFDALLHSHHSRMLASYVETLYRDLMYSGFDEKGR